MSSENLTEERRRYLAKVARMYFLEGRNQHEIARQLGISTASVSRAVAHAREAEVVHITINESLDHLGEMEIAMERRWGLRECLLVSRQEPPETMYRAMALRLTEYLRRVVRRGATVGVSWGGTLKTISENLGRIPAADTRVVPVIGAMGTVETGIYPNSIAREFARSIGGSAYLMNTPAVVDSQEIRDSLMGDRNFQAVEDLWRDLSMVLLSVSALHEETSMFKNRIFTADELQHLRNAGARCASNFTMLTTSGQPLDHPITNRIVNLPFHHLANVPQVVVVAAGAHKEEPLRIALESGVVTTVVTDVECARYVLQGAVQ